MNDASDDKKCWLHMVERPCLVCGDGGAEWYPNNHGRTIALAKELAAERDTFRNRLIATCSALKRLRDAACNGDVSSADLDAADEAIAKAKVDA